MQRSWVSSANHPQTDFPLQNLPYGVFLDGDHAHIGVAIGDSILDLHTCADQGLLSTLPDDLIAACRSTQLNALMSLGSDSWQKLRQQLTRLLDADIADHNTQTTAARCLVDRPTAKMQLPCRIGDYTDFYASIHHATRVGRLFRPEAPLLPNYKHIPIGYHGRASSIVLSGTSIRRPHGQTKTSEDPTPVFQPTQSLDYELEVGLFIGRGNPLGTTIPIAEAEDHIFGLCLLNDWSARDIQSWEYQPLGPFLAKSFATTISPWIIPLAALAPYRTAAPARSAADPIPLPYLTQTPGQHAIDLKLEVSLLTEQMRQSGHPPHLLSRGNLTDLYWTLAQLVTHHTSNGCNLRSGDLLATGTISGPHPGSEGCLLERSRAPEPITLPTGELRTFLKDGDRITFHAFTQTPGHPRIGFGLCTGTIVP